MTEYDVNRIEFVKTQKTKYFIQTSEHIFQICIDCIVHNDIFKKIFFHYDLTYSVKCFIYSVASRLLSSSVSVRPTLICLLSNTLWNNRFLQMETQLNMKLQMDYLQKNNWAHWRKCCRVIKVLHVRW